MHDASPVRAILNPRGRVIHFLRRAIAFCPGRDSLLDVVAKDCRRIVREYHLHVAEFKRREDLGTLLRHLAIACVVELHCPVRTDHERGLGQHLQGSIRILVDHRLPELRFKVDECLA